MKRIMISQKGRLPLPRRKGYFLYNNLIGLNMKKSVYMTSTQLKILKLSIAINIPKSLVDIWSLSPYISVSKRFGTRMGKGKSKFLTYAYKLPRTFNLYRLNLRFHNKFHNYENLLSIFKIFYSTKLALKSIIRLFPIIEMKYRY